MTYAAFRAIGAYIPPKIMTNADFEKIIDTTDEWITKRTGIKERRIAEDNEAASDLGAKAAELTDGFVKFIEFKGIVAYTGISLPTSA